jgi:hypothetical protein
MKTNLIILLFTIILSANISFAQNTKNGNINKVGESPKIEINYNVILSAQMQNVLKQQLPDFKIWGIKHFHPAVFTTPDFGYIFRDRMDELTYRVQQSPSAVIGDFNGDGKEDIVLDGYTKTQRLKVFLLSENNSYNLITLDRGELPDNFDPENDEPVYESMELVEKGRIIRNEFEKEALKLKTDAVKATGETFGCILYYDKEQKKFLSYTTGD